MCELFGLCSRSPVDAREYLSTFYRHSVNHPHGWGIMRERKHKTEIIKEPVRALDSRVISDIIRMTEPQTTMMAHIRLATVGSIKYENCHPYTGVDTSGRRWTMIHNGTVYSGVELSKYLDEQTGDTDSERIFLYLIDEINKAVALNSAPLSVEQRCGIVDKLAVTLSPRNKLNFMVYDGEILYVHKNMRNTLSYKRIESGFIFSTEPLDSDGWKVFPMTQVNAFKDGERIFQGSIHEYEFVPALDYITALDAMNI